MVPPSAQTPPQPLAAQDVSSLAGWELLSYVL